MNNSHQQNRNKSAIRVLVIEDYPEYAELVASILAKSQQPTFDVMTAGDLQAGLDLLSHEKPDVILLDMTLPDSRGMATLRKTMAAAPNLPIVMMTGQDDESLVTQALHEGAQDYLIKGQYEIALLSRAIHYAIERKRGQMALRASDNRFKQMIEKNADPIIIIDDRHMVRFANPAVADLFGRDRDTLIDTVFSFPLPAGDQASEIETIDAQGRPIIAEMRAVQIEWQGLPAHLASLRDITEHKCLLAELEQTRQQDLRVKDVFLSKVSHELRSPLSVIHQFTTILLDGLAGQLNQEQKDHLSIIFKNVEELRNMIDDLLQVARSEINEITNVARHRPENLTMVSESTQLDDLVEITLTMLRTIAAKKEIQLSADLGADLPMAHADPHRISQVLNNLVNNAIKFTPTGGDVRIGLSLYDNDPNFLCVSVQDNGPGVDHTEKDKIFEYLYQADGAIDNSRKGLGIGLYICREIIERHGGEIWVESQSGCGSTFFFTLPVFSLEALVAKILPAVPEASENVSILTVEVFSEPLRKLTHQDQKVMSEVWNILKYCVLPDFDLVLPRIRRLVDGEVFFIVACSPPNGIEALIRRINGQLRQCTALSKSDLVPIISTVAPQSHEHGLKIESIVSVLNQLVNEKVHQRRQAHE